MPGSSRAVIARSNNYRRRRREVGVALPQRHRPLGSIASIIVDDVGGNAVPITSSKTVRLFDAFKLQPGDNKPEFPKGNEARSQLMTPLQRGETRIKIARFLKDKGVRLSEPTRAEARAYCSASTILSSATSRQQQLQTGLVNKHTMDKLNTLAEVQRLPIAFREFRLVVTRLQFECVIDVFQISHQLITGSGGV